MNRLQLLLCFLVFCGTFFAQPNEKFYGGYSEVNSNGDTELYEIFSDESVSGSCFTVLHTIFTVDSEPILSEGGMADCLPKNGKYGVQMNSEKTNLWISFSEDGSGFLFIDVQKSDLTTHRYRSTPKESSEDPEIYDPYTDQEYTDSEGTEEETHEPEPDLYISESGAQFYLVSLDGFLAFGLIGATNDNCEMNDIDGALEMDNSGNFYTYKNEEGCEVFRIELNDGQLTLTEGSCHNMHAAGCDSWSGIYYFYVPSYEPEHMDMEGTDEVIYYGDEESATEQEPDLYIREDGTEFYFLSLDGFIAFALVGAPNEQCEVNDLDGSLFMDKSGAFYTYTNNDCEVFRIELKEDQLILKEGKCKDVHAPGCTSWAGTYRLYFE